MIFILRAPLIDGTVNNDFNMRRLVRYSVIFGKEMGQSRTMYSRSNIERVVGLEEMNFRLPYDIEKACVGHSGRGSLLHDDISNVDLLYCYGICFQSIKGARYTTG